VLDPRGQLLRAALGFADCSMPFLRSRALGAADLARLLGRGRADRGRHGAPGLDLQLTRYNARGWRAVQGAAREALRDVTAR
jgi:hypothetical protein